MSPLPSVLLVCVSVCLEDSLNNQLTASVVVLGVSCVSVVGVLYSMCL